MTEQGIVVATKSNNYIEVRIGRNSACASCGKCGMTEKQKHVDFFVENTQDAKVGDTVSVEIPETNPAPLAFVGYILPLIPALGLLFAGIALQWPDWASLLMFVGGLAIGFSLLVLIDRLRKHKWMQAPTLLAVVARAESQVNALSTEKASQTGIPVKENSKNAEDNSEKVEENSKKEKKDE